MVTIQDDRAVLRLASAMVLGAVRDARKGDQEAAGWLREDGLDLLKALGYGVSTEKIEKVIRAST